MKIMVDIPMPEEMTLEIWGKEFNVQMGEAVMVDRYLGLFERAQQLVNEKEKTSSKKGKNTDQDPKFTKNTRVLLQDYQAFIDDALGEGAAYELFGKRPVGIKQMVAATKTIVNAATKGYTDKLDSYE